MKYKLRTHEVEAVQWDGKNLSKVIEFVRPKSFQHHLDTLQLAIENSRILHVAKGEWLVRRDKTVAVYQEGTFQSYYEEV